MSLTHPPPQSLTSQCVYNKNPYHCNITTRCHWNFSVLRLSGFAIGCDNCVSVSRRPEFVCSLLGSAPFIVFGLCVCVWIFSYTLIRILPTKTIYLKRLCVIIASNYVAKPRQSSCHSAKEIHRISLNATTVIIQNNKWNEKNLSKTYDNKTPLFNLCWPWKGPFDLFRKWAWINISGFFS